MQNPTFPLPLPLLLLLSLPLLSIAAQNSTQSPTLLCKSNPFPKLCRSILSMVGSSPSDPYGYGKFSIKQCLKQAQKFSDLIDRHLIRKKQSSAMTHMEFSALSDCRTLSDDNVDFLRSVSEELRSATSESSSSEELVEKVETLLSAVVTNQQTCFDGLADAKSGVVGALTGSIGGVSEMYSVSLGLVTAAMRRNVKKLKKNRGSAAVGASGHKLRKPLQSVIKFLQHRSPNTPRNGERILAEMGSNSSGILVNSYVIVSSNGTDNFTTIADAIECAPNNTKPEDGYFIIYVRQGVYQEYLVVSKHKKNIMLLGDGINNTVIAGNHSFVDGWSTFNSSTFTVAGERFVAIDITFRNTAGPEKHQAVAVRNSADLSTFYRCSFEAYQDTLYAHSLRQFYRECDVYGTVDFIFGNAAAVFQNCNLYARKPLPNQKTAFTAQGRTDPNQNTGFSIQNCTIEAAPDMGMDLNSNYNYLGRPWRNFSRTVYMQSYIGALINPVGWLEWSGSDGLDTLYYGEFENHGPGASTGKRVQWPGYSLMNASQAVNFTVYNLTLGDTWLPNTDIPFSGGLQNY